MIGREHVPKMNVIEHALDARRGPMELIPPLVDGRRRIAAGEEDAATRFFKLGPNETPDGEGTSD
jgi:hypothetical protein